MPPTYREWQPSLYPTFLQDPYGQSWGRAQGEMKDRVVTLAADAVDAGLVLRCPDDALPYLGADVSFEQGPEETTDEYRARIAAAWSLWPWAGTETGLRAIFTLLTFTNLTLASATELNREPWAQWFAFVSLDSPPSRRTWGAPEAWGSGVWGSDVPRTLVRQVRRFTRRFSNARDRGWVVLLLSSPGVWGAPRTWGAPGVWGGRNPRWRI